MYLALYSAKESPCVDDRNVQLERILFWAKIRSCAATDFPKNIFINVKIALFLICSNIFFS